MQARFGMNDDGLNFGTNLWSNANRITNWRSQWDSNPFFFVDVVPLRVNPNRTLISSRIWVWFICLEWKRPPGRFAVCLIKMPQGYRLANSAMETPVPFQRIGSLPQTIWLRSGNRWCPLIRPCCHSFLWIGLMVIVLRCDSNVLKWMPLAYRNNGDLTQSIGSVNLMWEATELDGGPHERRYCI